MSDWRLSELARHLCQPDGIVASDFSLIKKAAARAGIEYDLWQQGLLTLVYGKLANGQYACGEGGAVISICRQVGKTFTIGSSVFIQCAARQLKVLWTAHRTRTSDETFKSMCKFAENKVLRPYVKTIRRANGQQEIEFKNGSRIMFGAREQGFGRGFDRVDMELFDEAQILTVKALDDMIPATNTAPNPLIIFMGTPPKPGDPSEVFAEKRAQGLAHTPGLLYVEMSADPDADPSDRAQWAKANPSYPQRTSAAAITRMRNLLGEDSFRREGLGIWDEKQSVHAAIPQDKWQAATVDKPDLNDGLLAFGIDMPPDRSTLTIAACIKHAEGSALVNIEEVRATNHEGTMWAVDYLAERWPKTAAVVIDAQSPAMSLLQDLQAAKVQVTVTQARDLGQATGRFLDMLNASQLDHLPDADQPQLAAAVRGATLRTIGRGGQVAWQKNGSDIDISPLQACTLALHGAFTAKRKPGRKAKVSIR